MLRAWQGAGGCMWPGGWWVEAVAPGQVESEEWCKGKPWVLIQGQGAGLGSPLWPRVWPARLFILTVPSALSISPLIFRAKDQSEPTSLMHPPASPVSPHITGIHPHFHLHGHHPGPSPDRVLAGPLNSLPSRLPAPSHLSQPVCPLSSNPPAPPVATITAGIRSSRPSLSWPPDPMPLPSH